MWLALASQGRRRRPSLLGAEQDGSGRDIYHTADILEASSRPVVFPGLFLLLHTLLAELSAQEASDGLGLQTRFTKTG